MAYNGRGRFLLGCLSGSTGVGSVGMSPHLDRPHDQFEMLGVG
jgi:hypothetical protein